MEKIKVCIAGATGWAGSELARGVHAAGDMELVAAVSRTHAGSTLGQVLGEQSLDTPIFATVEEALKTAPDVLVEYTKPQVAKGHALAALEQGAHVVVGTSGLSAEDYAELDQVARRVERGVLAVGNFALTVVLLQKFAEMAARYIPNWEIIDYAHADKRDVPSGTARELANRLAAVQTPHLEIPLDEVQGPKETRGAQLQGTQVHSVRLPSYIISLDTIFGLPDERLILRYEGGPSAKPYVNGALLAIRGVNTLVGVHRGLDSVMGF